MELNEIKQTWTALDNRLKENNTLSESTILKMAQGKAEKSIKRLLRKGIIGILIIILILPLIVYFIVIFQDKTLFFRNLSMIVVGVVCIFELLWEIYKISVLMKIDLSKEISSTIYHVNKYKVLVNQKYFALIYFVVPVLFILAVLTYTEASATFSLWIFLGCMFLLLVFILWYSNKKYKKTHEKILASLDEIKELKEE